MNVVNFSHIDDDLPHLKHCSALLCTMSFKYQFSTIPLPKVFAVLISLFRI